MEKLWLIKDKKGRIFGPYSEKEICFYIEEGEFTGEEFFSSYPTGQWQPLSAHSLFYKKILDQLHGNTKSDSTQDEGPLSLKEEADSEKSEEYIEPTRIVVPKAGKTSKKNKKIKIKLSQKFKEEKQDFREEFSDVIEMEDVKEGFIDKLRIVFKLPTLIFILLLSSIFLFLKFSNKDPRRYQEEQVRLLSISKKREPLTKKELKMKLQKAIGAYFKGTIPHYLNAQMQLVQALEAQPKEVEIYQYLCLIYLEIWPFAYQDTKDKNALKKTLNFVSQRDQTKIYSDTCKSIKALIDLKPEKALMLINNILNAIDKGFSPIFFYYIKAKALNALNKKRESRNYLNSIYKLRPEWIAPYMMGAQIFYEDKQYDLAGGLYQKVLSVFPGHISASLRLGIIEYKYLKKWQNSERRLKTHLLNLSTLVEPDILIEAYTALANIYLNQKNQKQALEYSNKAYALNPEHPDVLKLKSKLSDIGNFDKIQVRARGLIYQGDAFVSQGNCLEAQKYFSKAYKVSKRNSLAAFRMAQCYWQSGASGQAILWLRRAINADVKMLESYFLLANYLSELYDFDSAKDILSSVKRQKPSNYDLFKAYALLAFRQKKYQEAIVYAERSLKFYTSDVEIYILLSKTYRALGETHKAFSYANKAIQEDPSIQAQITYALSLDSAYGFHRAKDYFEKLIGNFPLIIDYSQALGEYYFDKGLHEKAIQVFQNVIQKHSKFKPAYIYLGRVYNYLSYTSGGNREYYEKALEFFLEATLLDISDPKPLFYTGKTHLDNKQYYLAEKEFEKILKISPNYPLIHYYVGLVNFYQEGEKNLEKALKFAKIQSSKDTKHYISYKLAGDIYRLRAKGVFNDLHEQRVTYELCVKEYQKALKYLKGNIEISIHLIECYKGSGDIDLALQLALSFLGKQGLSGHPDLYKKIGSIYEIKEQYEEARRFYNDYFALFPGAKDRKTIENRIHQFISNKKQLSSPNNK